MRNFDLKYLWLKWRSVERPQVTAAKRVARDWGILLGLFSAGLLITLLLLGAQIYQELMAVSPVTESDVRLETERLETAYKKVKDRESQFSATLATPPTVTDPARR